MEPTGKAVVQLHGKMDLIRDEPPLNRSISHDAPQERRCVQRVDGEVAAHGHHGPRDVFAIAIALDRLALRGWRRVFEQAPA